MWESRVAPLSGVVFVAMITASALIINNFEFLPPADELAAFYAGDSVRIMTGAYVGSLGAFFLLWFSGSVYAAIRRSDVEGGRLAMIAFGGGVFASAMFEIGYLTTMAAAERASIHGVIDPGSAAVLSDISALAFTGAAFGLAGLIGASALASHRSGHPSKLVIGVNSVIALGLISPLNWIVIGVAIVWVAVAGIRMYREGIRTVEPTPAPV